MFVGFLACEEAGSAGGRSGGLTTSAGWEVGDEATCGDPTAEPAWEQISDELEGAGELAALDAVGEVALVELPGRTLLLVGAAAAWDVDTRELVDLGLVAPAYLHLGHDLDGDGAMDLLETGDGVFVAWSLGQPDQREDQLGETRVLAPAVLDFEGDGDLDIFAVQREYTDGDYVFDGYALRNEGGRRFVAVDAYDASFWGGAFDILPLDFDDDGDPDLLICNDQGATYGPNNLLLNEGGTFVEAADQLGTDLTMDCMGVVPGDLDGDGALDLVFTGNNDNFMLVWRDGVYADAGAALGLPQMTDAQMGWGVAAVDIDHDGDVDVPMTTGDFTFSDPLVTYPTWLLRNAESGFEEVGADVGLPQATIGRGLVVADVNGDDVLDLLAGDGGRTPNVLASTGCVGGAWLDVEAPEGSVVTVEAEGRSWIAAVGGDAGYGTSGPTRIRIGLGEVSTIDAVTARVPWQGEVALAGPLTPRRRVRWKP
jgi:hypothetical protein